MIVKREWRMDAPLPEKNNKQFVSIKKKKKHIWFIPGGSRLTTDVGLALPLNPLIRLERNVVRVVCSSALVWDFKITYVWKNYYLYNYNKNYSTMDRDSKKLLRKVAVDLVCLGSGKKKICLILFQHQANIFTVMLTQITTIHILVFVTPLVNV